MTKVELTNFMSRIKAHYQDFSLDEFKVMEWYEQLKDYDVVDLNLKFDNYVKSEFGDTIPRINYLINGLIKIQNKGVVKKYIIECPMCHYPVSLDNFDRHYSRCSSVTYLCLKAEKIYKSKLNKSALYTMSDKEFNNTYMKFLNKTIDKHSMQETKMIMKILYPNNSDDVINDMVKSLFKVENEGEGYGRI